MTAAPGPERPPPRPARLRLRRDAVERIDQALSRLGYDSGERKRWRSLDPDTLWVLSLQGRVGIGVIEVRSGDTVDPLGSGWERGMHWDEPRPGRYAYAVFYADGYLVTPCRFYRASKAVETALRALQQCENMTAKDTATR